MSAQAADPDDLLYAPAPVRPDGYLHPSRMTPSRCASTLWRAAAPDRALSSVEAHLSRSAGGRHCVMTGSGREALKLALDRLGAGPGGEVVLSTFNCTAVADAVLATGATPVLVDCDEESGPDFTSVELEGRAVVLTNGLGLDEWARHGELVLEHGGLPVLDLAQAVPGPDLLARCSRLPCPVVLSFGEGKPLGGIGGGALLMSPDDRPGGGAGHPSGALRRAVGATAPLRRAVRQNVVQRAPAAVRTWEAAAGRRQPFWSHTKADHLPTRTGAVEARRPTRWEAAATDVLLRSAAGAADDATVRHTQIRDVAASELTVCRVIPSVPDLVPGVELLFARRGERQTFARVLARHGIPSTWNYFPLHRTEPYARYAPGPLPGSDHLWPRTLTVPKQPQPRMRLRGVTTALRAADEAVRRARGGVRAA